MNLMRVLGGLAVLVIMGAIGVVVSSFFVSNDLFTSSEVRVAAAASVGVFVVAILLFISAGRPWNSWKRTPYW